MTRGLHSVTSTTKYDGAVPNSHSGWSGRVKMSRVDGGAGNPCLGLETLADKMGPTMLGMIQAATTFHSFRTLLARTLRPTEGEPSQRKTACAAQQDLPCLLHTIKCQVWELHCFDFSSRQQRSLDERDRTVSLPPPLSSSRSLQRLTLPSPPTPIQSQVALGDDRCSTGALAS